MLKGRAGSFPFVKSIRARAAALILAAVAGAGCKGWSGVSLERRDLVIAERRHHAGGRRGAHGLVPGPAGPRPVDRRRSNFKRIFKTALPLTPGEQVLAQPLVVNGKVLVVTEANNLYLLDEVTGAITASRALGAAFDASGGVGCGDIKPTVGITGTPVIDTSSNTAYFFSKASVGRAGRSTPSTPARSPRSAGFPVTIAGTAQNEPTKTFNAVPPAPAPGPAAHERRRLRRLRRRTATSAPTAAGSSASRRPARSRRSSRPRRARAGRRRGIWMSGAGLMSDGAGTDPASSTGNG